MFQFSRRFNPFKQRTLSKRPNQSRNASTKPPNHSTRNKTLAIYITAGSVTMIGLAYLSVPLYRLFCQVTGFGGTTHKGEKNTKYKVDYSKEFTVTFSGQVAEGMPWSFTPSQTHIDLYPGETALAFYEATNTSDQPIIGIATYGVTPPQAGLYFEKIECFCFDEQRIGPHETVAMPVLFVLNPDLMKAKNMKDVYTITLSYTFFESTDQNIYDPITGKIIDPETYVAPEIKAE